MVQSGLGNSWQLPEWLVYIQIGAKDKGLLNSQLKINTHTDLRLQNTFVSQFQFGSASCQVVTKIATIPRK